MEKTKNIAKFAIRICIFAIFLSQGAKECFSQEFISQAENPLSRENTLSQEEMSLMRDGIGLSKSEIALPRGGLDLSQREAALPHDILDLSQDEKFLSESGDLLSQAEDAFSEILPQELFLRQNFGNAQICDSFIAIKSVEVFVDNIREDDIERQIQEIASAKINDFIANSKQNASDLEANIVIRQRSYYKSTDRRNSIYVYYSICDKNGKRVAEDCFVTDGRASIISAATQVKQVKKTVHGMKKSIKDYDEKSGETFVAKR